MDRLTNHIVKFCLEQTFQILSEPDDMMPYQLNSYIHEAKDIEWKELKSLFCQSWGHYDVCFEDTGLLPSHEAQFPTFKEKPNSSYKVPMKPRAILAGKPVNTEQLGNQIARALGQAGVLFVM